MADLDDLKIPKAIRPAAEAIMALTDQVCAELLDEEYAGLARSAVAKLARKRPSPIQSTLGAKAKQVRDLTKMSWYSTEFLRADMVEANPAIWFIQVDGLIMDARELPIQIQAQAFDLGVIPYIPALGRDGTAAWLSESGRT